MKKLLCVSASVVAMAVFCATAEEAAPVADAAAPAVEKPKKEHKADMPKPELKEITVSGTVAKSEGQDKKGNPLVGFTLTTDDGTVVKLPKPAKPAKGAAPALNLADYVGAKVKVTGMGYEKEAKGKKVIGLQKITNIEKL